MADSRPVVVLIAEDPARPTGRTRRCASGSGSSPARTTSRSSCWAGVHLLDEDTDELVDGDDISRFRSNLKALGVPFHVEAGAVPAESTWNAEGHPVVRVTRDEIAALVGQGRRVLVF